VWGCTLLAEELAVHGTNLQQAAQEFGDGLTFCSTPSITRVEWTSAAQAFRATATPSASEIYSRVAPAFNAASV
jgi:hypothetical protein